LEKFLPLLLAELNKFTQEVRMVNLDKAEYKNFFIEIKERIRQAQYDALKSVNKQLIALYWDIGKKIVEKQESLGWGKSIVENLSSDLQKEFPGIRGFSAANLWRIRNFYSANSKNSKLAPLVREIAWAHNLVIMEKCKDDIEREFYIKMTKKFGWTKNVLIHQVENQSYQKYLLNQTNFEKTLPAEYKNQAKLAVKDEYTFDFLELGEEHSEHQLEIALINNIRKFLIEMGGNFTFIGNQFKIQAGKKEYFVDLLLYHRKLRCLFAVDLKISDFKPEYAGKMQFYLSVLNDKVKLEEENPSIGLILCKEKDRLIVEYALKDSTQPIGISSYKITTKLPKELRKYLPSPSQISEIVDKMELL
jgi:predicted nuclease of restriction endonuclease-like (RecB) superfamily